MICPKCGKEIFDASVYCNYCGTVVQEELKRTKFQMRKTYFFLIVSLLLIVAGLFTSMFSQASYLNTKSQVQSDYYQSKTKIRR